MSAGLIAYRAATALATPAVGLLLRRRLAAGREDGARIAERLGRAGRSRPPGRLVWCHAASVGEALSLLPLLPALRARADCVLVTTATKTAAGLLDRRLPDGCVHQYVPVDAPSACRRFVVHWRPDLALFVESELWPNLIRETAAARVPLVLLNGRMSGRSFSHWARAPRSAAALMRSFALCLARSPEQALRLRRLGALKVRCVGDLKDAAEPLPFDPPEHAALSAALAGRPVWIAASIHPGEEGAVVAAHRRIADRKPGLLTIVAPRHPERGAAIAAAARASGAKVAQRSAGEPVAAETGIYVADTIGDLGLLYRLASVAFVGGSLVPHGGHNPLEPARLGCAVLHGPDMTNFAEIAAAMATAEAARPVADAVDLAEAVAALLGDEPARRRLADAGGAFGARRGKVRDAVLAELEPFLARLGP